LQESFRLKLFSIRSDLFGPARHNQQEDPGQQPRDDSLDFKVNEFQSKTFWQWSVLRRMIFISTSKAFVQLPSLPESFKMKVFSY